MLKTTIDALALTMDVPMRESKPQHVVDEAPVIGEKRKAAEPAEADGEESQRPTRKFEEKVVKRRVLEAGSRNEKTGRRRETDYVVEGRKGMMMRNWGSDTFNLPLKSCLVKASDSYLQWLSGARVLVEVYMLSKPSLPGWTLFLEDFKFVDESEVET